MAKTKLKTRRFQRLRRHARVRRKVSGTSERPRLVVYRSLNQMQGQLIDDGAGVTLVGLSTLTAELRERRSGDGRLSKTDLARVAGRALAERAREKGITRVVFDRGGYIYHGRVKAFAEGAREGGLEF
jgi:large subunit ribosomal protein L18